MFVCVFLKQILVSIFTLFVETNFISIIFVKFLECYNTEYWNSGNKYFMCVPSVEHLVEPFFRTSLTKCIKDEGFPGDSAIRNLHEMQIYPLKQDY